MTGAYFRRQLLAIMCQDMSCTSIYSPGVSNASMTQSHGNQMMMSRVRAGSQLQSGLLEAVKPEQNSELKSSWISTSPNSTAPSWVNNYD